MDYRIREIKEIEYPILADFLYEAIFIPEGMKKRQSLLSNSQRCKYILLILRCRNKREIVGTMWVRIMIDYGHIDDETPSFAVSLYEEYRHLGLGTALMHRQKN